MPLKIIKKNTLSSNKNQTLAEKPNDGNVAPKEGSEFSSAFIDRITIQVIIKDGDEGDKSYASLTSLSDVKAHLTDTRPARGFKFGKRVVLGPEFTPKSYPHLSYSHYEKSLSKLRLEFSPAALGYKGMIALDSVLTLFLPDGWSFIKDKGLVTKIEISYDIAKISMSQIHVLPTQVTSAMTWSNNGTLQTLVLNKRTSPNQTRVYDRGEKRKANKQFSPAYEGVRVERDLKIQRKMKDLISLPNPFDGLGIVCFPAAPATEKKTYLWEMFKDSVNARSLPVALKLLPIQTRTLYRKRLEKGGSELWDPKKIWARWPKYLEESLIL